MTCTTVAINNMFSFNTDFHSQVVVLPILQHYCTTLNIHPCYCNDSLCDKPNLSQYHRGMEASTGS